MNKIVNGVANDFEFPNLYDPNISYSKAYTEQLLEEKDKEIERLNNIINELEEYFAKPNKFIERPERIKILDRIKELKEGK